MKTTDETIDTLRIKALAQFTGEDIENITAARYGDNAFEAAGGDYLVLTDEEADAATLENIRESVWAFNASFILSECDLPSELTSAIQAFQEDKCESANEALLALVEKCCKNGLQEFAQSAISADGRGHFLSCYDGEENEEEVADEDGNRTMFFIYRTN